MQQNRQQQNTEHINRDHVVEPTNQIHHHQQQQQEQQNICNNTNSIENKVKQFEET